MERLLAKKQKTAARTRKVVLKDAVEAGSTANLPRPTERSAGDVAKSVASLMSALKNELAVYKRISGKNCFHLYDGPQAPALPEALVKGCVVLRNRERLLEELPKGCVFAEVGGLHDFSSRIADIVRPSELHIFCRDLSLVGWLDKGRFSQATEYYEGIPSVLLSEQSVGRFDIVCIDGEHDYDTVWSELVAAHHCTMLGGYIVCSGYTSWSLSQCVPYGVLSAVNRFAIERKMPLAYLALQPNGYYDVALRKLDLP